MALTLYVGNKNFSSWSMRPWLALVHAGAQFDEVMIGLDLPDSTARIHAASPGGRVPALRDGDLTVWESIAICEYLAEKFPEAHLWPSDAKARAVARAVSAEMHAGFAGLRSHLSFNLRRKPTPISPPPDAQADIHRIIELWDDCRARFGQGGPFLFGAWSIADAMYAPVAGRFRSYAVALPPSAEAYVQAIYADAAMQRWLADAKAETLVVARYEGPNAK